MQRTAFPRLYFLSDSEVLTVLSGAFFLARVAQAHHSSVSAPLLQQRAYVVALLRTLYEGVAELEVSDTAHVVAVQVSGGGFASLGRGTPVVMLHCSVVIRLARLWLCCTAVW